MLMEDSCEVISFIFIDIDNFLFHFDSIKHGYMRSTKN